MNLQHLKTIYWMGDKIKFDITDHPRIPNAVIVNGKIIGTASKSTIKAFEKFIKEY